MKRVLFCIILVAAFVACDAVNAPDSGSIAFNTDQPISTVRLCFIHHSCGRNWLSSGDGDLGLELNLNNYYVTETYYGWDAEPGDNLGDRTNTDDWQEWFNDTKMPYVYDNSAHYAYSNTIADPGGENEIMMFKSCYPLSEVGSGIEDEKALYDDLLDYFALHTDKLFVLVTPPGERVVSSYELTRDLGNWLVDAETGWLSGYPHHNVAVFDFYCVLSEVDSHHTIVNGEWVHEYCPTYDGVSPYHDSGDNHPNTAGNQKATIEFVPLLNYYYNRWQGN